MKLKLFRDTGFAASSAFRPPAGTARELHPAWAIVLVSLWTASAGNVAMWRELSHLSELQGLRGVLFCLGLGIMVASFSSALLSLLAWRYTLKPVLSLFLLAAGFGAHFMLAYGVVIDTTMMVNVLQTDPRETRDLLGWRLLMVVTLLALLPMLALWRLPLRPVRWLPRIGSQFALLLVSCLVFAATLMLVFQDFASVMRNHTHVRFLINPLNSIYALIDLGTQPMKRDSSTVLPIGQDAQLGAITGAGSKPPMVVLVLGETARAGNFSLNGYERATTPALAREDVVSLRNVWSCGTSTASSVPCMFSHLGREAFPDRKSEYENLLDVLQRAGLAVLWLDNQSGCKGVCDRIPHASTTGQNVAGICKDGECLDEVLLHELDARIQALPAERRARGVVVVMHQMGSHGPAYYKRSPPAFKRFMPECTSNALQQCERTQVVNAYDNSIAYTDHFLATTIAWLKARKDRHATAMVYLADHGESLGENNLYLHGLPYSVAPDVQKRVPWITWLSPEFAQQRRLDGGCLKKQLNVRYSHDNYFHSVLGLLQVQTSVYQASQDLYSPCMTH